MKAPAEISRGVCVSPIIREKSVAKFARTAYINMGKSIFYQELDELSRQFASYLQRAWACSGCQVALMMPTASSTRRNVCESPASEGYQCVNSIALHRVELITSRRYRLRGDDHHGILLTRWKSSPYRRSTACGGDGPRGSAGLQSTVINLVVRHVEDGACVGSLTVLEFGRSPRGGRALKPVGKALS